MITSVTVAVLTFRRPADLAVILPLLVDQARGVTSNSLTASVLVVDNCPDRSAEEFVLAQQRLMPGEDVPLRYEHEPIPGISAARNRALAAAHHDDYLVFIDDDERPSEEWLSHLLAARATFGSTAVVGPVVSTFSVEPSEWVAAGSFFARRSLPTGTFVDVAATNNLLIELAFIRETGLLFDLAFGITGGDDTMFTRSLRKQGGTIVWCSEAVVTDVVPPARVTVRWVLQRAFSSGNGWSLVALKLADGGVKRFTERARLIARGTIRLVGGTLRAAVGTIFRSSAGQARGLRTAARGIGMLSGAVGYSYQEYRRN